MPTRAVRQVVEEPVRLVGLMIALLLAIAACSNDDDNGPPPTFSRTPTPTATATPTQTALPNIVFIILDDVGIDQVEVFGLGQGDLASTPNLTALANAGVRFSNTWSMPECSPSRATIFTGRFPLRTGVTSALIPNMLPQAQVSPYETTLPRVLAPAGYTSAVVDDALETPRELQHLYCRMGWWLLCVYGPNCRNHDCGLLRDP